MKVKAKNLGRTERIETLDALYTATSLLKGRDAMKAFLKDLLTESERVMLGRRIMIARGLLAGTSYKSIQMSLGVAPNTIRRVERWLEDTMPGYEEAITKLEEEFEKRKRRQERSEIGTLAYLKERYPLHFLLFPYPKLSRKSFRRKNARRK